VLYRAGALTAIHIPTEQEEAARDLLRCREDIRADLLRARHRLSKFLLRHGRRFTATKKSWSKRHELWLRAQTWPFPALDQTHRAYLRAVDETVARLRTVEQDLRALLNLEPLRPRVLRLRCFRGIDDLTALTIAAELGDPRRFPTAPSTMAFVASCRPSTPAGRNRLAARLPKPAMPTCDASWSKPRGTIATIPSSGTPCVSGSGAPRPPSSPRRGRRSIDCIAATNASPPAANRSNTSSPPSPVNSPALSGPR
jgi:transposase